MENKQYAGTLFTESPWLLSEEVDWSALQARGTVVRYKKNTIIYHQNNPSIYVYIVQAGRVNVSILGEEGEEKCLYVAGKGTVFGEIPHLSPCSLSGQATAKTDCVLLRVNGDVFGEIVLNDKEAVRSLLEITMKKLRMFTGQIELLSFYDTHARIGRMMDYMASQYGVQVKDGILIDMKFTHQELASMVGASRVSVTKILNALTKSGAIKRVNGRYVVQDFDMLHNAREDIWGKE